MSTPKMRGVVYHRHGSPDVISIADVDRPAPKDGEVLVEVKAASVNAYGWHLLRVFIDRSYSLHQTPQALRHIESGSHKERSLLFRR